MDTTLRRCLLFVLLATILIGVESLTPLDVPGVDDPDLEFVPSIEAPSFEPIESIEGPPLDWLEALFAVGDDPRPSDTNSEPESGQLRIGSWNLYNFGRTKDDQEIAVAAQTLHDFDVVAVQEVVTSPPGRRAVGTLEAALDRTGVDWEYRISTPTTGDGTERYAILWKPSQVRLVGRARLASSLAPPIDREPYLARFEHRHTEERFLVASFHAVPQSKEPAREVALLSRLDQQYTTDRLILLGDFNLDEDASAFDGLRRLGYHSVLDDQATSLRRKRDPGPDGHLANEYDHIFVESGPLQIARGGALDFTDRFSSLSEARSLSDHLPIFVDLQWTHASPPPP